jgi:hypothetical protein
MAQTPFNNASLPTLLGRKKIAIKECPKNLCLSFKVKFTERDTSDRTMKVQKKKDNL